MYRFIRFCLLFTAYVKTADMENWHKYCTFYMRIVNPGRPDAAPSVRGQHWQLLSNKSSTSRCQQCCWGDDRPTCEYVSRGMLSSEPAPSAAAATASDRRRQGDLSTSRRIAAVQLEQCRRRWSKVHIIIAGWCWRSRRTYSDSLHWQEAIRTVSEISLETQVPGLHPGQKSYSEVGALSVCLLLLLLYVDIDVLSIIISFCSSLRMFSFIYIPGTCQLRPHLHDSG